MRKFVDTVTTFLVFFLKLVKLFECWINCKVLRCKEGERETIDKMPHSFSTRDNFFFGKPDEERNDNRRDGKLSVKRPLRCGKEAISLINKSFCTFEHL